MFGLVPEAPLKWVAFDLSDSARVPLLALPPASFGKSTFFSIRAVGPSFSHCSVCGACQVLDPFVCLAFDLSA